MKAYNWVKVGVQCKWNDPGINDYNPKDRKSILNRIFEVIDISDDKYDEDTIVCIEEVNGGSYAEVYLSELKPIN